MDVSLIYIINEVKWIFCIYSNIAQVISIFWAFALPAVGTSLYFYNDRTNTSLNAVDSTSNDLKSTDLINDKIKSIQNIDVNDNDQPKFSIKRATLLLWIHFKESYSNGVVVEWSIWWALAACGFSQVCIYLFVFRRKLQ